MLSICLLTGNSQHTKDGIDGTIICDNSDKEVRNSKEL